MPLDSLRADVWRAASLAAAPAQTVPTGDALLEITGYAGDLQGLAVI